ncbi:unnamed protein product [Orchesella dallaii]|uniref:G-protein coupled receptors family 1 profile domain-containing protein n=1 Tax=Orchesella dallaii TaxID=48710 RepID=A0ABP1PLF5_9HEXA
MNCKTILTSSRLRITIGLVWVLSAAISSPRFYYFSAIRYPLSNGQYEILCLPNRTKYNSKLLDTISMTLLFLIPLAIISVLYTQIGVVLWDTNGTKMAPASGSVENGSCYKEGKILSENNAVHSVNLTLLPNNSIQQQLYQPKPNRPAIHSSRKIQGKENDSALSTVNAAARQEEINYGAAARSIHYGATATAVNHDLSNHYLRANDAEQFMNEEMEKVCS